MPLIQVDMHLNKINLIPYQFNKLLYKSQHYYSIFSQMLTDEQSLFLYDEECWGLVSEAQMSYNNIWSNESCLTNVPKDAIQM